MKSTIISLSLISVIIVTSLVTPILPLSYLKITAAENIDFEKEIDYGFINKTHSFDFWYVSLNTLGTHVLFLSMYSVFFPSPIQFFLGQCYRTMNGSEIFIGNALIGFEIFKDLNNNSLLDADFSDGFNKTVDEIRYFFILNASKYVSLTVPTKQNISGIVHYVWSIRYEEVQGIVEEATEEEPSSWIMDPISGEQYPLFFKVLCEAYLSFLEFKFNYWIQNNVSYLKLSMVLGELSCNLPISFNNLSLSFLFATLTLMKEKYTINIIAGNKTYANENITRMNEADVEVAEITAFKFIFNNSYTLHELKREYKAVAARYNVYLLPGDEIYWVNGLMMGCEETLKNYLGNISPELSEDMDLKVQSSRLVYRVTFPVWNNMPLSYDPLYIAYITPSITLGRGNILGQIIEKHGLLIVTIIGVAVFILAVTQQIKVRRQIKTIENAS